jgi:hypothetical protein
MDFLGFVNGTERRRSIMMKALTDEGIGFVGMSVAFMAGAVTFGLIYNAMDSIGQSAVDNVVNRIR